MRLLAGRYRVEEAVGRGGTAVVHRGWDRTLKRRVAIKLFAPHRPDGNEPAAAVLREARSAAALNHPHIARVYDYGEAIEGDQRQPYLVMEFIDGDTLADRIVRGGALPWHEAVAICADTASALAAAHERNLVHRDIKPRNVMLPTTGVKVVDFGIAAAAGQNSVDTRGNLWGTPTSLAPEQLRGEPTYPAADMYGLGLLLFESLAGRPAWTGGSVGEILATRHNNPSPRLPRIAGLPREVIRLYDACVADDPADRPTAATAAGTLRRAVGLLPMLRPPVALTSAGRSSAGLLHPSSSAALSPGVLLPADGSSPTGVLAGGVLGGGSLYGSSAAGARPGQAGAGLTRPRQRSRRRAAFVASAAVASAVISVLGLQLANGTGDPNGRPADAAVDGAALIPTPQPIDTPPASSATPQATDPTSGTGHDYADDPVYVVPIQRTTDSDNGDGYDDDPATRPPSTTEPADDPTTTRPPATTPPTDPTTTTPAPDPTTTTPAPDPDPTDDPTTDEPDPDPTTKEPESTTTPADPDPTTDTPTTSTTGDSSSGGSSDEGSSTTP